MKSDLLIRRAEFKDADVISSIHWRSRKEAMPWLAVVHTALETRGYIARVLLKKEDVFVAIRGGEIAGYAAWRDEWLNHLYIHPSHQHKGVGTALLKSAKRAMPGGFRFWCFKKNAVARAFYEKHGCVMIRETDGTTNEEREPDVEYGWNLK